METLKAGDKRLISYAVDLGTRITEAFGSKARASSAKSTPAAACSPPSMAAEETRTYTVRNVDQKAKTLIIEHPIRARATRCSTRSPPRRPPPTTASRSQLAARRDQEFAVNEERVFDQTYCRLQPHPGCPRRLTSPTAR